MIHELEDCTSSDMEFLCGPSQLLIIASSTIIDGEKMGIILSTVPQDVQGTGHLISVPQTSVFIV